MDVTSGQFLGMAGVDFSVFAGLSLAALVTAVISAIAGTAGGLILLGILAFVFPPVILIPVHTVVQLGAAVSMAISRWQFLIRETVVPFTIGSVIGAAIGGRIFVSLPETTLQMVLGVSILILAWIPRLARFGPELGRFAFIGFVVTFLGIFVSATGTLLGAFTAAISPDRRNHIATIGVLMTIVHIAKVVAFGVLGVKFGSYAPLMAAMIATSFIGTWIGKKALDLIPERVFRIALQTILTALALRLILVAAGVF